MADNVPDGIQVYLANVQTKTGKSLADFKKLAAEKGLAKHGDLMAWLKADFALGHGHANAVSHAILHSEDAKVSDEDVLAQHFTGAKANWRAAFDSLLATLNTFGPDISHSTGKSYISLLRNGKKIGIVQVTGKRMDIGIKLSGAPFDSRFEDASAWNPMVTHRVHIDDPKQIDADVVKWLRQAYDKAG